MFALALFFAGCRTNATANEGTEGSSNSGAGAANEALPWEGNAAEVSNAVARGLELLEGGQFRGARTQLEEALAKGEDSAIVFEALGRCRFALKDVAGAEQAFQQAYARTPWDADLRLWLARCCFLSEDYAGAVRHSREALRSEPLAREYLKIAAFSQFRLKNVPGALANLEMLRFSGTADNEDLSLLADIYLQQGNTIDAAEVYEKLVETGGATLENYLRLANALVVAGEIDDAEKTLRRAEDEYSESWEILEQRGIIASRNGDPESAKACYTEALAKPGVDSARVSTQLGYACLDLSENERGDASKVSLLKDAAEAFQRALSSAEFRADAHAGLAQVAFARGDVDLAMSYYLRARDIDPSRPEFSSWIDYLRGLE
ncbi:MAG: tetratricopeptide repeat protein [Planctomycetes bacterium]|nr:tetratricopeptide repeat protein [Planctomycetota bacterium]